MVDKIWCVQYQGCSQEFRYTAIMSKSTQHINNPSDNLKIKSEIF